MKHFTDENQKPRLITDREGYWLITEHNRPEHNQVESLKTRFTDESWGCDKPSNNDPRKLLASGHESTFLAIYDDKIGVLTEAETIFVNGGDKLDVGSASFLLAEKVFKEQVSEFHKDMKKLEDRYSDTLFFTSDTKDNFDERLCLSAFTPIGHVDTSHFSSPYSDENAILDIDTKINEILY